MIWLADRRAARCLQSDVVVKRGPCKALFINRAANMNTLSPNGSLDQLAATLWVRCISRPAYIHTWFFHSWAGREQKYHDHEVTTTSVVLRGWGTRFFSAGTAFAGTFFVSPRTADVLSPSEQEF
jgi:hypothetical protein